MSNFGNDTTVNLHIAALWYAFGRQDAQHTAGADVFAFADQYAAVAAAGGHRPSIQQAWADYVAALRCPEVGVRGTQCTQPAGHVDDCTFAP